MKLSSAGLDFIVEFEGKLKPLGDGRYIAYQCPAKVWTIYAGCTKGVHEGLIVTEDQGKAMCAAELADCEAAVDRLVTVEMSQAQFDALVSFTYNCGPGALARSTILKRFNAGDREGAARAFAMWNKAGGKVLAGLTRRRAAEAALFLSDGSGMPQRVDAPAPVKDALTKSKTILGAVITAIGTAGTSLDSAMSVALEGLAETTKFEPLKAVAPHAKSVALALVMVGIAIVIGRRLQDAQTGKHSG